MECTVTNTGARAGTDVVQLYVHDPVASVTRPVRELRGFARIDLEPGASARVRFGVPTSLLSFCGPAYERIVEPGVVQVMIGRSSAEIVLEADVELVGDVRVVGEEHPLGSTVAVSY